VSSRALASIPSNSIVSVFPFQQLSFFFLVVVILTYGIADEGGATSMSGGIAWLTLPAGYLGSGLIGAALIACGFDTNASKVASLALAVFFVFTLWWARRNLLYVSLLGGWMAGWLTVVALIS
jgi:Peptidase M50B-like